LNVVTKKMATTWVLPKKIQKTVYPTGLLAKTVTICFEASQVHIFGPTTIAQRGVATICVL